MTTGSTVQQYDEARVVAASTARNEPAWLRDRRAEAARAFSALPMPTQALRPWRYVDLAGLDLGAVAPGASTVTVTANVPNGAFAGSLAEGVGKVAAADRLGTLLLATEGRFLAANAAQWSDGVLVYAPKGATFDAPVQVTIDASAAANGAAYPRVLVIAEEQAEVSIVLRLESGDAPITVAGAVEVFAGQAARVKLLVDDRWGAQTRDFTWVRARLERDSDVQFASIAMGGLLVKQTIEMMLEGEGSNSGIRAVALGDAQQHFDFVTLQDHTGPKTTSIVEVKAALAGASRQAYYGITRVGETAKGADADQTNRNLLISGEAKADSDPVLEILTADVIRCGHHAAVGPVDQEALFYLQSRGLDTRAALQQMVAGFFHSVVGATGMPGLDEDELTARVQAKLATAEL
ncbi:MAG: SufD family Fe-S cluster assembly protein [Chloroflexi bacterium]|nr:MAG: SufD family Fe-S cluster assembly protein [Chloroflexota bacterium]